MKLTKALRRQLDAIEGDLQRAYDHLHSARIAVAVRRDRATTTLDYTRPDGAVLCEINKEIGTNLTGLADGLRRVRQLLRPEAAE